MRLVIKDLSDKPSVLTQASTLFSLENIAQTADVSQIKDSIYKGSYKDIEGKTQSKVREKLNEFYFSKCAYCEMLCKAEIEHYRPKKGVLGLPTHQGYYWLCYEWSNLVPSCRYCNTEGGKGNQFPIKGLRVNVPTLNNLGKLDGADSLAASAILLAEQAYLLHPEIDNPVDFLGFSIDSIGVSIVGLEERGIQTIKICNLNREYVRLARKQNVLDDFIGFINTIFELNRQGKLSSLSSAFKIAFDSANNKAQNSKLEHTLLRQFMLKNQESFDSIVLPQLEKRDRKSVV